MENNNSELDFGKIFRLVLMQSKAILLFLVIIFVIGLGYYFTAEKRYSVFSLLQVYSNQTNSFAPQSLDLFSGNSSTSDIAEIQEIYKSRSNLINIIEKTQMNVEVEEKDKWIKNLIRNLNVELKSADFADIATGETFYVLLNEQDYALFNYEMIEIAKFKYNLDSTIKNIQINLSKPTKINKELIKISYFAPEKYFKKLKTNLNVSSSLPTRFSYIQRNTGLVRVTLESEDPNEGIKIINYANELFLQRSIDIDAQQSRKAIDFIDQRISTIDLQLNQRKDELKRFKEDNRSVNVDLEIEAIIQSLSTIDKNINEIEIEISSASNIYTDTNPVYLELIDQRDTLVSQKAEIEEKIKGLPIAQQEYIDLFMQLEITQTIYEELNNKKLEFSIKEASTLGNIRVVDDAYIAAKVSPRIVDVMLFYVLSFLIAVIAAIYRGIYLIPISNPAEFLDNGVNIPIAGVIPRCEEKEGNQEERFVQSIESFIVNIKSIAETKNLPNEKCRTILITSPSPENGKSFLSRETAFNLAKLKKKVLLIDADFKRGDQHKSLSLEKITSEEFYDLDVHNMTNYKVAENFYVIPKISKLTSSFQFLYSKGFEDKLQELKKEFDYIIIDTPPILSVSDTGVLLTHSDMSFGVCRHGITKMNEVKQIINLAGQIGFDFDGLIYNDYQKPSSYYGYYGLYANYDYQYYAQKYLYENYEYKEKNE